MKKISIITIFSLLLALLAGCVATPVVVCTCPTGGTNTNPTIAVEGAVKTGLAIVTNVGESKDAEIAKMQEELAYHEKFLKSVETKLNNPNFVSKAPEKIIAIERKKQSDATEKIAMLKESIQKLSK